MPRLARMILAASACLSSALPAEDNVPERYGTDRMTIRVLDHEGRPSIGEVSLCRAHPDESTATEPCTARVTDQEGVLRLEEIPKGRYTVAVSLTGFATTTVGPFEIGEGETGPHAPDRLVVVLNPVATHCTN